MRTSIFPALAVILLMITSCKDNEQPSANKSVSDSTKINKAYFPVLDFLKGDIRMVDSFSAGIQKYTIIDGKTDSSYIPLEEFNRIAKEFLPEDLSTETFEKNYKETSFFDQSTQLYTFTYSTDNKDLDVQRVDVLINNTQGFDKVKSVYIEKYIISADTSTVKKMYWKAGRSLLINSETIRASNNPELKQLRVVWRNWD
jgi:hypothetical protein